mgnify:FL=1
MALKQIESDLQVHGAATVQVLEVIASTDGADGVVLKFPAGTAGDAIEVVFQGNDGTFNIKYASITGGVEAWSPDDGFIGFRTSDGGILSEKVRVTAAGTLEVGGASTGTSGTLVGGLVVAGASYLNTIAHETTDVDVFLVSNAGLIKYRTGAELRSDIGAGTSSSDTWIPLTGVTSGYVTAQGASNTAVFLNGNGAWSTPVNTTYSQYAGTTAGLVPTGANSITKYLREDGTWVVPPDTNTQIPALTTEQVQDIAGGMVNVTGAQSGMGFVYNDTTGKFDIDLAHTHSYDNYSSWTFEAKNSAGTSLGSSPITSGDIAVIKAGTGITLSWVDDEITVTNSSPNIVYTDYAEPGIFSGGGTPTLASGVTAAEIRALIGAGTSSSDTQLTNAQVIAMLLTGFTTFGSASTVAATDSIFTAFRKLEYRVALNDSKVTNSTQTTINITANNTNNETVYPVFVDGATGTQGLESDTGYYYNPSTGLLSSVDYAGTSDIRSKENIVDFESIELDTKYKKFNFKRVKGQQRIGLIAQEVEEKYPIFVRTSVEGEKSISYNDLHSAEIAFLKKERRESSKREEALLDRVEALEATLKDILSKLDK